MSAHSSRSSESELKSIKNLVKQLAKDFQSLSYRYLEHEEQLKELKMAKGKDENSSKSKKSSHASSSKHHESFGDKSLRINEYYQCTALVVGCDDVASCYSVGVLTRCQVGIREGSRGVRVVASC